MRRGGVVVLALVLVFGVAGVARAAFVARAQNVGNQFAAGTVSLSDDDAGAALFALSGLVAGDAGVRCVEVGYGGTLAAAVKLYGDTYSTSLGLGAYLNLVIEEGSGATFAGSGPGSCPGFVAGATIYSGTVDDFAAAHTGFGSGVGSFAPSAAGQSRVFRFSYTLDVAAPDTTASGTASLRFVWEAQNT